MNINGQFGDQLSMNVHGQLHYKTFLIPSNAQVWGSAVYVNPTFHGIGTVSGIINESMEIESISFPQVNFKSLNVNSTYHNLNGPLAPLSAEIDKTIDMQARTQVEHNISVYLTHEINDGFKRAL